MKVTRIVTFLGIAFVLAMVVIPVMAIGWSLRAGLASFSLFLLSSRTRNTRARLT